jgi:hypothetical protein
VAHRLAAGLLLVLALGGRFFSTELVWTDEPTVMLALRSTPGWSNLERVEDRRALRGHAVLIQDENDYIGAGLYAAFVNGGWLLLCGVSVALFVVGGRRVAPAVD